MLVETTTDFLFLAIELVTILVGEVFITEELFYRTACPRLLLRLLACHHLIRNYILIFSIIILYLSFLCIAIIVIFFVFVLCTVIFLYLLCCLCIIVVFCCINLCFICIYGSLCIYYLYVVCIQGSTKNQYLFIEWIPCLNITITIIRIRSYTLYHFNSSTHNLRPSQCLCFILHTNLCCMFSFEMLYRELEYMKHWP